MSDTPRTDALSRDLNSGVTHYLEFARQLERELAAANAAILAFVKTSSWAAREYKEQDHVKPLFDIAEKFKNAKPDV